MIQITLKADDDSNKSELLIDAQEDNVGFTVIDEKGQSDFSMTFDEWELTKQFIDGQLKQAVGMPASDKRN